MKYKILAVGKIKEQFYRDAVAEYVKRLSRFGSVEVVEVDECTFCGTPNAAQIEKIKQTEGASLLQKAEGYVVAMDIDGKMLSSSQLSAHVVAQKQNHSTFTFIIGGSNGLSNEVKSRAHLRCSFGAITLPHQLFRVVLVEQLYRAACIENNVAYHK